jgi:hypothetical protein
MGADGYATIDYSESVASGGVWGAGGAGPSGGWAILYWAGAHPRTFQFTPRKMHYTTRRITPARKNCVGAAPFGL